MIITFCGHADFRGNENYEKIILDFLKETLADNSAQIYLGGYGGFDSFALSCCKKYKEYNPSVRLVLITPYISVDSEKKSLYDEVVYPGLEDKPLKFAISYRNRWMVENADFIVCAVDHTWGGAYATYKYAERKKKPTFNILKSTTALRVKTEAAPLT